MRRRCGHWTVVLLRRPHRSQARAARGQALPRARRPSTSTMRDRDAVRARLACSARVLAAGGGDGHRAQHRDAPAPGVASGDGYINRFLTIWEPDEQGHARGARTAADRARASTRSRCRRTSRCPLHNRLAGLLGGASERVHETVELIYHTIGAMNERLAFSAYERMSEVLGELGEHGAGGHADEAPPPRRVRPPRVLPHGGPRSPRPTRPVAAVRGPQRDHAHVLARRRGGASRPARVRRHDPSARRQRRPHRPGPAAGRDAPLGRRTSAPALRAGQLREVHGLPSADQADPTAARLAASRRSSTARPNRANATP